MDSPSGNARRETPQRSENIRPCVEFFVASHPPASQSGSSRSQRVGKISTGAFSRGHHAGKNAGMREVVVT